MADRRNLYGNKVKFFVSNLPEGCTPWELRRCMEVYGEVAGSYVARKRDKLRCRFGFVSFSGVRDKQELLGNLGKVRMGEFKLRINVARFALENSEAVPEKEIPAMAVKHPSQINVGGKFAVRDGRSFKEVVGCPYSGNGYAESSGVNPVAGMSKGEKVIIVPDRVEAFKELQGLAVVGRVVDLETLVDIDRLLSIAKFVVANIQYLGGLSVLISFHEEESVNRFLSVKNIWEPWFSKLDLWKGQTLPFERVAWLKLSGMPLHLFEGDILNQVGSVFGKVLHVHVPKGFEEDLDLSIVRVGVLVGHHRMIEDEVVLSWKERAFRVGIEEDHEVWVPDCLKRLSVSGSAGCSSPEFSPVMEDQPSGSGENQKSGGYGGGEESQGSGSKMHGDSDPIMGGGASNTNVDPMREEREGVRFEEENRKGGPSSQSAGTLEAQNGPEKQGGPFEVC
ncbi:putative RNA recognition motif domain, nucleotide-binding alpha-beta plait domain superfamily [Helianthus annuus]|nr:putative RNA recognition motif domain, nucleotide-binding alpha-beta plait domain superfamily [Helianthus annuus]